MSVREGGPGHLRSPLARPPGPPLAVAFDCDGTIADTESPSLAAWSDTLTARGVRWSVADLMSLVGRPFADNWAVFSARGDLGDEGEFRAEIRTRFRARIEQGLEVHEDVVRSMQAAHAQGVAVAVVSSSTRDHVGRVLEHAGVVDLVRLVVASGDTPAHKPAPDPYLAACAQLGVEPDRTAAVEDTPTGARSSRAAGLWTVAVRRAHTDVEVEQYAHLVVDVLEPVHLGLAAPS